MKLSFPIQRRQRPVPALMALTVVALLLVGCGCRVAWPGSEPGGTPAPAGPQVVFPSVAVSVELAQTEAEREKGLGGHAPLGEHNGMLFIFDQASTYAFWMKGMTFPLDIIWFDNGKVVHVGANLPAPTADQNENSLPIYSPGAPAKYVVEVNAGFADKYGIGEGTPVQLKGA